MREEIGFREEEDTIVDNRWEGRACGFPCWSL